MSVVEDVDEEEEESVVDWGVKTVLDASGEGLLNESGALSTSFASPLTEAIKRVLSRLMPRRLKRLALSLMSL